MKSLLTILSLALILAFCNCHNGNKTPTSNSRSGNTSSTQDTPRKHQDVRGLGELLINKTTINDIGAMTELKKVKNNRDIFSAEDKLSAGEIINSGQEYSGYDDHISDYFFLPGYRFVHLYSYKIGDDKLDELELFFYNDTLFSIKSLYDARKIETAFKYKYGEPGRVRAENREPAYSELSSGVSSDFSERNMANSEIWGDDKVNAEYFWSGFDAGRSISFVYIYDVAKQNQFDSLRNDELVKRKNSKIENYKKNF